MTKDEFVEIYAPCKQYLYSMHEDRCHNGKAPTLRDVCTLYGADFAMQWVCTLIDDLQGFTSAKTRLNDNQRNTLAAIICTQYRRLKATEMLLFLIKAKAGQFGKFYNTIDPMDISTALAAWHKECERIKAEYLYQKEQERQDEEREKHLGECMSIEEAIKRGIVKNPLLRKYFGTPSQDAKDGDVLAFYSEHKGKKMVQVGIIEKYVGKHGGCSNTYKIYAGVDWDNHLLISAYMGSPDIQPATIEQRDQLNKAMADAGWEYDYEKKELKKIVV